MNIILDTDSYKFSHSAQYPKGTTHIYSYMESRGGKYPKTLNVGLQAVLKRFETKITREMVEQADKFVSAHMGPGLFNKDQWMYIIDKLDGKLPLKIKAPKEGLVIPVHNVLMTIENTDPNCHWLTGWAETQLMRLWYPITVATQSFHIKKLIMQYLEKTSDDPHSEINFKLHDFGSRGVSSQESAALGGMAHLVNFMGSDTGPGILLANEVYKHEMSGFSIPAAEHSTITSWGRENEVEAYGNMLKQFGKPGALLAIVSDSYDLYNAVENLWGKKLKQEVISSGATVVIRPDSGNPTEVVLKTVQLLDKQFGSSYNSKMFKVLNHVKVIQGDGINEESIREILEVLTRHGYSASNIAFGMGGALLQQVNRDTQKFAIKCSEARINGKSVEVFKDPITDSGKRSKKGRLDLILELGQFKTIQGDNHPGSLLQIVYENGKVTREQTFDEIRKLSNEF